MGLFDAITGNNNASAAPAGPTGQPAATPTGGQQPARQEPQPPQTPAPQTTNPGDRDPFTGQLKPNVQQQQQQTQTPLPGSTPAHEQQPAGQPQQTTMANLIATLTADNANAQIGQHGNGVTVDSATAMQTMAAMLGQSGARAEPDAFVGLPLDRLGDALKTMDLTTGLNMPEIMAKFQDPDTQQEALTSLSTNIMHTVMQVMLPLVNAVGERAVEHSTQQAGNTLQTHSTEQAAMTVMRNDYPHLVTNDKLPLVETMIRTMLPHSQSPQQAAAATAQLLSSFAGNSDQSGTQTPQSQGSDFAGIFGR